MFFRLSPISAPLISAAVHFSALMPAPPLPVESHLSAISPQRNLTSAQPFKRDTYYSTSDSDSDSDSAHFKCTLVSPPFNLRSESKVYRPWMRSSRSRAGRKEEAKE